MSEKSQLHGLKLHTERKGNELQDTCSASAVVQEVLLAMNLSQR